MNFLNPTAGLLALSIALPALLLLYFLKLRRRPIRVSSTLLWEQAAQDLQVNVPFRWLRFSWLLVLQALAMLCIIAAIARPTLNDRGPLGRRAVLLIDTSASMSARDGAGEGGALTTRFAEAQRRAQTIIDDAFSRGSGNTQLAIAQFASTAGAITPFTSDAGQLREALSAILPTDQPAQFAEAIRLAQSLAIDKLEEDASAEPLTAIVLSDGGFSPPATTDGPGVWPATNGVAWRFERVGPSPTPAGFANVGIVSLSAKRDYEDPATLRLFVRVINASTQPQTVTLRLSLAAARPDDRTLQIPGATATEPGEATTSLTLSATEGGVVLAQLLEPDLLASDNFAAIVLPPAKAPSIILVAPGVRGEAADPFLLSLLRSVEGASVRLLDAEMYEQFMGSADRDTREGEATLKPDLVVFDRITPARIPRAPSLSFGAGLPALGVTLMPPTQASAALASRVVNWQREHPLLRYVNLDAIAIQGAMTTTITSPKQTPGSPIVPAPRVQSLAEGPDGPLITLLDDRGIRRVIVAFELDRSSWGPHISFPVFLANTIDVLTLRAEASTGRWFKTDQPVVVAPAPTADRVTLFAPAEASQPARELLSASIQTAAPGQPMSLGVVARAGVYDLQGSADTPPRVAINLADATESLVATADQLDIPGAGGTLTAAKAGGGRELWPFLVMAAIGLLTLEWFLYAWRMRS